MSNSSRKKEATLLHRLNKRKSFGKLRKKTKTRRKKIIKGKFHLRAVTRYGLQFIKPHNSAVWCCYQWTESLLCECKRFRYLWRSFSQKLLRFHPSLSSSWRFVSLFRFFSASPLQTTQHKLPGDHSGQSSSENMISVLASWKIQLWLKLNDVKLSISSVSGGDADDAVD